MSGSVLCTPLPPPAAWNEPRTSPRRAEPARKLLLSRCPRLTSRGKFPCFSLSIVVDVAYASPLAPLSTSVPEQGPLVPTSRSLFPLLPVSSSSLATLFCQEQRPASRRCFDSTRECLRLCPPPRGNLPLCPLLEADSPGFSLVRGGQANPLSSFVLVSINGTSLYAVSLPQQRSYPTPTAMQIPLLLKWLPTNLLPLPPLLQLSVQINLRGALRVPPPLQMQPLLHTLPSPLCPRPTTLTRSTMQLPLLTILLALRL
jgi:hypothetical protein